MQAGPAYLVVIQGREALHLTRLVLDFIEALHAESEVTE